MAQDSNFVPAWKRLGLKLRSDGQSGDTAPDVNEPQNTARRSIEQRNGPKSGNEDSVPHVVPTEIGTPSKLGKRKHVDNSAEEQHQTPKKSKTKQSSPESAPIAPAVDPVAAAKSTPQAGNSKGDPNYRKKKTKRPTGGSSGESRRLDDGSTLLPSTENGYSASLRLATPEQARFNPSSSHEASNATLHSSPSRADRRKSVTFTPDTKTSDGNSAQNLFKKWVSEQKSEEGGFSSAEVNQFAPPPKSHPANDMPTSQPVRTEEASKKKKQKKNNGKADNKTPTDSQTAKSGTDSQPRDTNVSKGKKDFSLYTSYLTQYHEDRDNWKFNKAKQNSLLDNALNIFRIPNEHMDALVAYVQGLKGASLVDRLIERCETKIKELDGMSPKTALTDEEARDFARLEALDDQLSREKRRRQTNADLEQIAGHPFPEAFVGRLERRRAAALLEALNMSSPFAPKEPLKQPVAHLKFGDDTPMPLVRNSQKRKSRTDISSDESSSDSSSEDSSSDESSSEDPSSDESSSEEDSDESDSEASSDADGPASASSDGDSSSDKNASDKEDAESTDSESEDDSD
ncbi:hypothetical protein BU24DRAFT_52309 [Aaosphaeria arxii CBS 175.79]|uniref:WKF domain-containing protein n=1 Tax=Aaosphaeria arxii CBS 175.79 TaxID=1450172 RepID=A0A6A5XFB1_9PLEO|nr:uncharacterized protein BU24DRAFT_52309 [Aaosphaeria arxii CBS 175.79]KAF2011064.1 hypothetical protein BU24DRAFT_52309 [Aaosphaeria arxii CBS 175.79]